MEMAKTVDEFFGKKPDHLPLLEKLRSILLKAEFTETIKWGMPTYTIAGKNVVGIGSFKSYAGLWFFNGSFLSDPHQLLINAQEGKTKGMRQLRFASLEEIDEEVLKPYLLEAIQNSKDGKVIKTEKKPLLIPDELQEALSSDVALSEAFNRLKPGQKKEYAEYISEAKRTETRMARLQKIAPMIQQNIGLNDKYKP